MTAGRGQYDAQGNACLTFHLCGVRHEPPGLELTGIIDTGFTGFLQLPLAYAIELALPLEGTTTVADGSTAAKLLATGRAALDGEQQDGTVIVEFSSSEILIGMEFLRRFDKALLVSRSGVQLIDESGLSG